MTKETSKEKTKLEEAMSGIDIGIGLWRVWYSWILGTWFLHRYLVGGHVVEDQYKYEDHKFVRDFFNLPPQQWLKKKEKQQPFIK